jgi:Arc/MetJ-type ribon-helix-helix transcriptional regulator
MQVVVTAEMHEALMQISADNFESASNYIRRAVREQLKQDLGKTVS